MKLNDLFRLDGKVALITGGGKGIGKFIATGYFRTDMMGYMAIYNRCLGFTGVYDIPKLYEIYDCND